MTVPSHVSNDFFAQFPNCLSYASKDEFVGNLFYAMTHSPEPLSNEYLEALSWRAATKRLEAAGCIPVVEAEKMEELHSSTDGGVEIPLPLLIESEARRKQISTTFRYTRRRFMQFRSRLSSEILSNPVLPKKLKERIAADLQKKLDLEIDEILESPKLRLKLSPAELDKTLLELYDNISAGPSGDVLRMIGGGGSIGLQNMYMRRQAMKKRGRGGGGSGRGLGGSIASDLFPFDLGDWEFEESNGSVSQWIRWALRRNLPPQKPTTAAAASRTAALPRSTASSSLPGSTRVLSQRPLASDNNKVVEKEVPRMSLSHHRPIHHHQHSCLSSWTGLAGTRAIMMTTQRHALGPRSCTLLI